MLFSAVFYLLSTTCLLSVDCSDRPRVLMVALDGLRPDNITADLMPNLHALASSPQTAVAIEGMRPQFMVVTAVNFVALTTGLGPEDSGIVDNGFVDPDTKERYDYFGFDGSEDVRLQSRKSHFYTGTPLWQSNNAAGGRTACFYWPLCDAEFNNVPFADAEHLRTWTQAGTLEEWKGSADQMMTVLEEEPVNFGMFYIGEPDLTQHYNELGSATTRDVIQQVDLLTKHLMQRIEASPTLHKQLNVIFLSDHGHANLHFENVRQIFTAEELDSFVEAGFSLYPVSDKFDEDSIYAKLVAAKETHGFHYTVYRKRDFPRAFKWANSGRVGPIIVMPDVGYWPLYDRKSVELREQYPTAIVGGHGWKDDKNMRAFFLARGPDIRGLKLNTMFDNTQVYPLVCRLLKMEKHCPRAQLDKTSLWLADQLLPPELIKEDL